MHLQLVWDSSRPGYDLHLEEQTARDFAELCALINGANLVPVSDRYAVIELPFIPHLEA